MPVLLPAEPAPAPPSAPEAEILDLGAQIRRETAAVDRGIEALDQTIEAIRSMQAANGFNEALARLLAQMVAARASSLAKLRGFSERIRSETLELSPEQTHRAIVRYVQTLPRAVVEEVRSLLDERLTETELYLS